ncbi:MAG: discoidin domain-containing protein [Planctomycetota bacterium]
MQLPGSLQAQGYGTPPGPDTEWVGNVRENEWARLEYAPYRTAENFKMPFWLQPEHVYTGSAWFSRTIEIPEDWNGQHTSLSLERAHWVTEAWLDGKQLGTRESLSTPHFYDIGAIEPGTYTLDLRVSNEIAYGVGPNAHSITDHTQTNWNGVVGAIELVSSPMISIEQIRVEPNAARRTATVTIDVINRTSSDAEIEIELAATNPEAPGTGASISGIAGADGSTSIASTLDLGDNAALWSEFTPHAYTLDATLESDAGLHKHRTWFGLRDVATEGTRITINGSPVFLRGTLECAIFPKTGYPPTDVNEWARIFDRMKDFGLNHMRFHSWCPPRAAFLAADRAGIYLQVEGPFWVNQGPQLGLGDPIDRYVYDETDRILAEFGNHPSFVMMAYGNEPSGPGPGGQGENFLGEWLETYKASDTRRIYTSGSGWPIIDESQFHVAYEPRIQRWGEGLNSTINSKPPTTKGDYDSYVERFGVPVVAHEIGQWCVFPDFNEIPKYTGHLKAKNFEIFRDLLEGNGLGHRAEDFLMASGRLQVLSYKEEIEAALRTGEFGGFQLLDIHDFPGQGTALVGVLDPFWDPKPYVSAEEFRRFCAPIVPLARFDGRTFVSGDELVVSFEVAHYGPAPIEDASARWTLTSSVGEVMRSGSISIEALPVGELSPIGSVSMRLATDRPVKATLEIDIDGHDATNSWDIWIMPDSEAPPLPTGVHLATDLDEQAERVLAAGGTVLFAPDTKRTKGGVAFGFSPVFWNTAWTDNQAPHTLGLRVDPEHTLFGAFPTGSHTDWQWWDLIGWPEARAGAMVIDALPTELEPLVQPIDTWFRSRRLASVFEARVGDGKLLVSTIDIATDLDRRPAAKQFRASMFGYIASDDFDPGVEVSLDAVRGLFRETSSIERTGVSRVTASSEQRGYEASLATDGDTASMWHTSWTGDLGGFPHELVIELQQETALHGIRCLGRQDGNTNGAISDFEVQLSTDGDSWIVARRGRFTAGAGWQTVMFPDAIDARYVKVRAIGSVNGGPHAALAELDLIRREDM